MAACLRGILRVLQLGEWAVLLLIDSLYGLGDLPEPSPPKPFTGEFFIVPPSDPVNLEYFAMLDEEGSR